eukprot:scaffold16188_cov27-Attheya_sp.AAC.1
MESLGSWRMAQAIVSEKLGIECYHKGGMTNECAKIWVYNGLFTQNHCWQILRGAKNGGVGQQWTTSVVPTE